MNNQPQVLTASTTAPPRLGKYGRLVQVDKSRQTQIGDSEYATEGGAGPMGMSATTVVPKANDLGGLASGAHVLGAIAQGQHFVGDVPTGKCGMHDSVVDTPVTAPTVDTTPIQPAVAKPEISQEEFDAEMRGILGEGAFAEDDSTVEKKKKKKKKKQRREQEQECHVRTDPAPQHTYEAPIKEPIRVKISGDSLGTYRGKFAEVTIQSDIISLIVHEDADVFTPPASNDLLTISCEGEEYGVYFAGLEVELPFHKQIAQIYFRNK